MGGVQAYLGTDHAKAVVKQASQGVGCSRTATGAPRPHLATAVARCHAVVVPSGFLFFPRQTILTPL